MLSTQIPHTRSPQSSRDFLNLTEHTTHLSVARLAEEGGEAIVFLRRAALGDATIGSEAVRRAARV